MQLYLVFAARAADTVAAALLRTAALYLAGEEEKGTTEDEMVRWYH